MADYDDRQPLADPDSFFPDPDVEEVAEAPMPRHRRPVFMTVVVMTVAAAGVVAWYGLSGGGVNEGPHAEVPLVLADPEPFKVRPEDPGGMEVPDRDKLVYDRLDGEVERPAVERLLPPPEALMEPPGGTAMAPDAPPPAPPPVTPEPITREAETAAAGEQAPAPPAQPAPLVSAAPVPPPPPPPAPETRVAQVQAAPATVAAATAGGFKVQLGSVRSMEAAQAEWKRLSGRHGDVLGDLDVDVERADLGERGTFFRLRAGPLASEQAASSLCSTMKSRDVACLVVKP